MLRTTKNTLMGLGFSALALMAVPDNAYAGYNDHCREYTRTVYIGRNQQEAYGTACLQSDGSWMIVGEGMGNDIPNNVTNVNYIIRDNDRYVTPTRVAYYSSPHVVYKKQPSFVWNHNGFYRGGHYVPFKPVYYKPPHHRPVYRPAPVYHQSYRSPRHNNYDKNYGHDNHNSGVHFNWNGRN